MHFNALIVRQIFVVYSNPGAFASALQSGQIERPLFLIISTFLTLSSGSAISGSAKDNHACKHGWWTV